LALTTTYEYDRVGNVILMIDPRGHDTQYVFNTLDQVVREISREVRDGSGVRYQSDSYYDANNNLIRRDIKNIDDQGKLAKANAFFTAAYEYEILNNLIRVTQEEDTLKTIVTEYAYDNNRNRTLTRYGEATAGRQPTNVMRTLYDERDLVFREIRGAGDPKQSTTQYDYDRNGNLVTQRHGLEDTPHVSTFVYDAHNRRVSETDPMSNVMSFNYDANGNRVRSRLSGELNDVAGSATNVRLDSTVYVYDALNRLIRTETEFFDTDAQIPIDDGLVVSQIFYSDNSQVLRRVDDNNHETQMRYDTANRLSVTTDDKGDTITYVYDANNNAVSVTVIRTKRLSL
jgi:YD repeat-containing protein